MTTELERIVMCKWIEIKAGLPEKQDYWYLFGGITDDGTWQYDKLHLGTDGSVSGWSAKALMQKGFTHWCDPEPPETHNTCINRRARCAGSWTRSLPRPVE